MIKETVLVCFGLACLGHAADDGPTLIYPVQVEKCLKMPVATGVEISVKINPYYLRGDFDGDGKQDYAVAVYGKKNHRLGVLICTGTGQDFLLGADTAVGSRFSTMPDDNFFAPNWAVYSRSETEGIAKYPDSPHPFPLIHGETIAMIYEDGIGLIYWDGKQFKWAG